MFEVDKLVVSWPVGRADVRALVRVYGGAQKDQKKNLEPVPVGSWGELIATFYDNEYNRHYGLIKYELEDGRFLWVRSAPWLFETT